MRAKVVALGLVMGVLVADSITLNERLPGMYYSAVGCETERECVLACLWEGTPYCAMPDDPIIEQGAPSVDGGPAQWSI